MLRELEPELMEDPEQVKAYAEADFEIPHQAFIDRLEDFVSEPGFNGTALDLGCGPCDIALRFAKTFPFSRVDALDGSKSMLDYASLLIPCLGNRIRLIHGRLPFFNLPEQSYEIIYSNSFLHHLPDPQVLWRAIKFAAKPGARIAVMDLLRPDSRNAARKLVANYASTEPEILQHDFYHSLLAAFTLDEIAGQLNEAGLALKLEQISDRHVFIKGIMP